MTKYKFVEHPVSHSQTQQKLDKLAKVLYECANDCFWTQYGIIKVNPSEKGSGLKKEANDALIELGYLVENKAEEIK